MKFLVVGLGNPGKKYKDTRHNLGWMILDGFFKEVSWHADDVLGGYSKECRVGEHTVLFLKPTTFMNKSGGAVSRALSTFDVKKEHVVVVHDEIDLPFGAIKVVKGRGDGGHRGVASIIRELETNQFVRVRVGVAPTTTSGDIAKPKGEEKVLDFLMSSFSAKEQKALPAIIKTAREAVAVIVKEGVAVAMNQYN